MTGGENAERTALGCEPDMGGAESGTPLPRLGGRYSLRVLTGLVLLLILTGLLGAEPTSAEQGEVLVSIEARSEDVRQILQQLATAAGINLVVDDSLTTRITLKLQNVPLNQALQSIAKAAGASRAYSQLAQGRRISGPEGGCDKRSLKSGQHGTLGGRGFVAQSPGTSCPTVAGLAGGAVVIRRPV
ncbi:MAG: hypothetical protein IMX00_09995 [Limnochordales bacterium]|nr:hypothetical protein [Limnochordales bacterium]